MTRTPGSPHKRPRNRLLVQAQIRPVDADGRVAFAVGTLGFAIAAIACWWNLAWLRAHDAAWWLWVCVAGTLIGLFASGYCAWRLRRPKAQSNSD